jgi:hypothetical protein
MRVTRPIIVEFQPPDNFTIRAIYGEKELEKHVAVSYAAFESEKPYDQYINRYLNFMSSPVYDLKGIWSL